MPPGSPLYLLVNKSLRVKIILGVILPLVIILGVFAAFENKRQQEAVLYHLTSSATRSVRVIENSLRHAMLKSDFSEVQTVLDSINTTEDFRIVYLLDTNGKIIFAPNQEGVGNRLNNAEPGCSPCHRLDPDSRPGSIIVAASDGQEVFRSMYPIRNSPECSTCHDPNQKIIGLLLTDLPVDPVEQALEAGFRQELIWWVGMILLIIVILSFSIDFLVVKRLKKLTRTLQDFGKGHYDIRLEDSSLDEFGQLSVSFNEMGKQIETEERVNQELSNQLNNQNILRGELLKRLITAQEDERKRVARELHDDLGQGLSALSLQVQYLERLYRPNSDEAIGQLDQINDLIVEITGRMYELIFALRPSLLDEFGLVAALRNHAEKFLSGSGILFTLEAGDGLGRLPPAIETALYRVFQEGLSNVRKHADAKNVKITLDLRDGTFIGKIEDDGRGFDLQTIESNGNDPRGLGMLSIKERIAQYCGQVEILSQPGKGTTIIIQISGVEVNSD